MNSFYKGLFAKIYGLILVSSLGMLILALLFVNENYQTYKRNEEILAKIPLIRSSINLLSSMQLERGMSIAYVNGANNLQKLKQHRAKVDLLLQNYKRTALRIENKERSTKTTKALNVAFELREKIEQKEVTKKPIAKNYTFAIRTLMEKNSFSQ